MSRLIDADALMEEVNIEIREYMLTEKGMRSLIRNAPTIDAVEVVRGEWIDEHEGGHGEWVGTCNQCGKTARVGNFCPNCGVDMREREGE